MSTNPITDSLRNRKSVRAFEDRQIPENIKQEILQCAAQAPTAGNQQLYTILDITDQALKEKLAVTCDNQPFIAKAPLVLAFCADVRRWRRGFALVAVSVEEMHLSRIVLPRRTESLLTQEAHRKFRQGAKVKHRFSGEFT